MIQAEKRYLVSIFKDDKRFMIPFFQRRYSWEEENWKTLWESVEAIYLGKYKKEYFLGSLIIKQEPIGSEESTYNVVDGQQRLITLSIILKSLQNECRLSGDTGVVNSIEKLLLQKSHKKELRLLPSRWDRKCYKSIIESKSHEEVENETKKEHRIRQCYDFFANKISSIDEKERIYGITTGDRISSVKGNDIHSLILVEVGLGKKDNEQEIFDTVNSFGEKLKIAELIKNYMFKAEHWGDREKAKSSYERHWYSVFEKDYERSIWWGKDVTIGRRSIPQIDNLLYSFLVIQRIKEEITIAEKISMDHLFDDYKSFMDDCISRGILETVVEELKEYAQTYRKIFTTLEGADEIRFDDLDQRLFMSLHSIDTTYADPLVLYHYHNNASDKDKHREFIESLDSYLIRLLLCFPSNSKSKYDRSVFMGALDFAVNRKGSFVEFISRRTEVESCFPSDDQFKRGFMENNRLKNNQNKLILYSIALKQNLPDRARVPIKNNVEHLMPQKWRDTDWEAVNMTPEQIYERESNINLLGNLTLVNKRLNSSMRNEAWKYKKEKLKMNCRLPLTTDFLDEEEWGEEQIKSRGIKLFDVAREVWPPLEKFN